MTYGSVIFYLVLQEVAVAPQNGLPARNFIAYHQNDSLLFQFILSEFLEVFLETQALAKKLHSQEEILRVLTKLVGSSQDMRLFSWNHLSGQLAKLKNYCSLFLQNADSHEKEPIALQYNADKAWIYCLEALDLIHQTSPDHTASLTAIEKACSSLQRFARLIVRLLPQFRDDENVIFFVLRHHEKFDALYGSKFINRLFYRMYPKGPKEAGFFLTQKYLHRGFDNLLPLVASKISELESVANDNVEKTIR